MSIPPDKKDEIEALKAEIELLNEKLKQLKGESIVDGKRIRGICRTRETALSSRISYIVRAAVDGEVRKSGRHYGNITCNDGPKAASALSLKQREAARELSDKIIDAFESVYLREMWKEEPETHND